MNRENPAFAFVPRASKANPAAVFRAICDFDQSPMDGRVTASSHHPLDPEATAISGSCYSALLYEIAGPGCNDSSSGGSGITFEVARRTEASKPSRRACFQARLRVWV